MTVPERAVRSCKLAVLIERSLNSHDRSLPDRGGRYLRHRVTVTPGPASPSSRDERDILLAVGDLREDLVEVVAGEAPVERAGSAPLR